MKALRGILILVAMAAAAVAVAGAKSGKEAKAPPARPPADSAAVAAGAKVYAANCALCHGPRGHGDGPGAVALNPKPRNFTDPKQYRTKTDEEMFAVIQKGGAAAKLSAAMPVWGTTLKKEQIWQVIAYIRTLPAAAEKEKSAAQ
jgi:mono/diheme cytochrome c family protein